MSQINKIKEINQLKIKIIVIIVQYCSPKFMQKALKQLEKEAKTKDQSLNTFYATLLNLVILLLTSKYDKDNYK